MRKWGSKFGLYLKWALFPGVNLHARLRYKELRKCLLKGEKGSEHVVLDAGSGNGMLSYAAYRNGARVIGVSIKEQEVAGCRLLFNEHLGISELDLRFECGNLYDLNRFGDETFDEVICSETLEHIRGDEAVCASFWRLLRPGGTLHLCAPNSAHPYNASFPLDPDERGGHVRPGYTETTFRRLLEPIGFKVTEVKGLGGPIRQAFNWRIKEFQGRLGVTAGVPLFVVSLAMVPFDHLVGGTPFSIYVRAKKSGIDGNV